MIEVNKQKIGEFRPVETDRGKEKKTELHKTQETKPHCINAYVERTIELYDQVGDHISAE